MYPNNQPSQTWPWCRSVVLRNPAVTHRACTPLELLFDLCFVVSVAALVVQLHHELVQGAAVHGALTYVMLFMPICWGWMLFSWFATSYDNDDVIYRLLTLAQMAGVLALTITIPGAFRGNLAPFAVCYVAMRVPLILKWIRSAHSDGTEHRYAMRATIGLTLCQLVWLLVLVVPVPSQPVVVVVVMVLELCVPPWAIRAARHQVFHAQHVTERYGLFAIIVLGESILAATTALEHAFVDHGTQELLVIGAATLVSAFCVWWLYFDVLDGRAVTLDPEHAVFWGHGHLVVFCAIGAMGAAADVAVKVQSHLLAFDLPMRLAVVVPAVATVLALTGVHSVTERSTRFHTVGRVLTAAVIGAVGLAAGEFGPVASTLSTAALLLALAVGETLAQGFSMRRLSVLFAPEDPQCPPPALA